MRTITALAVTFALLSTASATAQTLPIRTEASVQKTVAGKKSGSVEQAQLRRAARQIGELRRLTWSCQDDLGVSRTKASTTVWALPQSVAYRIWTAHKWVSAAKGCQKQLRLRSIPATNDWQTAVRLVQRIYPGTSSWLLYISHREGGHGGFVMNHEGSGAGGWMQFMASTYYSNNDAAFADARARGFIVNEAWNQWTHPLGQAITAGYMKYTGRSGCHWCL